MTLFEFNGLKSQYPDLINWHEEFSRLRQHLHAHPELGFEEHNTSALIVSQLSDYGVDVIETGWAKTGVVALVHGKSGPADSAAKRIALRADIDALPMQEKTDLPYASKIDGKMHGCGHDGHTVMLLAAAKYLAKHRNFDGTAMLIFQPAEEVGGEDSGGGLLVQEGLFKKFPARSVWGMHNWPSMPLGHIGLRAGPMMAACDQLQITVHGKGGHAARPHMTIDPVVIGAQLITALQTIVSRNLDPLKEAVISITCFNIGEADNVIVDTANLLGTIRSFDQDVRNFLHKRIHEMCDGIASAFGATITCNILKGYPPVINNEAETTIAARVAERIVGAGNTFSSISPSMGGEDFSFLLTKVPGCYIRLGTGKTDQDPGLHHPCFDFNDSAIPIGAAYWVNLIESELSMN